MSVFFIIFEVSLFCLFNYVGNTSVSEQLAMTL